MIHVIKWWSDNDSLLWSNGCFSKDCPQHWQLSWEDEQPKHNCCWHSRLQGAPLFLMFLSEFLCCQMFSLFDFVFNMLIGTGPTGHRICGGTYECSWRRGLKAKQSKCSCPLHLFILRLMIKSLSPLIQVKEIESFVIVYKYKDRFTSPFARTLRVITKMFGECVLHNFTLGDVN